jgi:hypothetical protein
MMRELLYLYQEAAFAEGISHPGQRYPGERKYAARRSIPIATRLIKRSGIAYHQSRMQKTGDQWTAQLIFEIWKTRDAAHRHRI